MSIATGTRLGTYERLSAIGAGGMGEAWRGRDSRLKRDVAGVAGAFGFHTAMPTNSTLSAEHPFA